MNHQVSSWKDLLIWDTVSADLKAALTVAIVLIPQGLAYALLAGLPPIYGLYTGLIPLLIYPFFGTSRYLSVGPVAIVSILVLSGLSEFAEPFSPEFIQLALLTSLISGGIQCLLSICRMGYLVNFLSKPVISGFTAAAAIIIALSQMRHLFGLDFTRGGSTIDTLRSLFSHISETNWYAFLIGAAGLTILVALKKIRRSFPRALFVVLLAIATIHWTSWYDAGVQVVGAVPSGLPSFALLDISWEQVIKVLPLSIIICIISFIESLAIARTLGQKNDDEAVQPNKELMGLGLAKVVGAFFQAFPNTGSFTRSTINEESGAKSRVASLYAAAFIGIILIFLTEYFFYLPKAILASIVVSAVLGLIDFKEIKRLYRFDRDDFYVFLATFILTLLIGVQLGVFIGIIVSLLLTVAKASKPHYAILGKLPESGVFRNKSRFPEAIGFSEALIFRYDADLFFGNSDHFRSSVLASIQDKKGLKHVILDMSSISSIDSTAWDIFEALIRYLAADEIELHLANTKGPIRDKLKLKNLNTIIGDDHMHMTMEHALECIGCEVEEFKPDLFEY